MFGDGFFSTHPLSFPRLMEDSLWHTGIGEDLLENQVMDFLEPWVDRDMVSGPRAWARPRRRCPYTCVASRPRRPTHRHFVVLPRLASDDDATPSSCDGLTLGRGARADPVKAKDKNSATGKNSMTRRKQTACTCSSEDSTFRERQASAFTGSREGCTNVARDSAGCCSSSSSTSSSDTGNARCESPWQFSVDMSGCNEVRAMTEGDMLMVEGRGSSDSSHRMMRYITSLPRHVSHDSLTARLNNGRLTVSQKPGIQHLEGQARALHIDMQQQQQQQQQQKTSENTQLEKTLKSVEHSQAEERQEEHSLLDQTQEERSREATFS